MTTMKKNDCPQWNDLWIERGSPPAEARTHAASCANCRAAIAEHEATWARLGPAAEVPAPSPGFRAGVWTRIDAAERADRSRLRRIALPLAALGVAAAIVLVAVFRPGAGEAEIASPPAELLANLDLYENLEFLLEESGEELDWIAAMESALEDTDGAPSDGESSEE